MQDNTKIWFLPGTSVAPSAGFQSSWVYRGLTSICSLVSRTRVSFTSLPLSSLAARDSHLGLIETSFLFWVAKTYRLSGIVSILRKWNDVLIFVIHQPRFAKEPKSKNSWIPTSPVHCAYVNLGSTALIYVVETLTLGDSGIPPMYLF